MDKAAFRRDTQRALAARNFRGLVTLTRAMREQDPDYADAWFLESVAAEAGKNVAAALRLVGRAIELAPETAEYWVQKARCHARASDTGNALHSARRALALGVSAPEQLDTLGVVLTRAGDFQGAVTALRSAVAGRPKHPQMRFNLAAAEQFLGNESQAREHFEAVLAMQPDHARSYWALSEIDKNSVSDRREAAMRALAEKTDISDSDALYLAHALARIEESRGQYGEAIQRLSQAKARRRAAFDYRFDEDRRLFEAIRQRFSSRESLESAAVDDDPGGPAPLFIVGLPRSGTTLLERIVASHSGVESLGELQELPLVLKALSGDRGRAVLSPQVVESLGDQSPALQSAYARAIEPRLRGPEGTASYVVDKMPLNFFYLGYVLRHMPRARILLLRRDAMDAGLSNFRQLFALEFSYYNYSYDLADTGRYCAAFEGLAAHWESLAGERLFSLRYEDLVSDPEPLVRSLLDYLGLPWESQCLDFHNRGGVVATPSAAQVRQPLYRDAVGRWRRYGDALKPLQDALVSEGVAVA